MTTLKEYALMRVGVIPPKPFNFELNEQDEKPIKKSKYDWAKLIEQFNNDDDYDYYCNAGTIEPSNPIVDAINDIAKSYDYGMANYIIQAQFNMSLCDRP